MRIGRKTEKKLILSSNAFMTKPDWSEFKDEYQRMFEADIKKSPLLGRAMSTVSLSTGHINYKAGGQNAQD